MSFPGRRIELPALGQKDLDDLDALAQEWHVGICPVQGLDWCEIDNRSDLSRAEEILGLWEDNRGIAGSPLISGGAA